jgi:uncharacterized protein YbjT (DUF2867 family)
MILVMGATGHIGSKIIANLLTRGLKVRGLARHFPNPENFRGAELIHGDANNVSVLMDAMRDCSAVFTMIPPDPSATNPRYYQNKFGEVIAEAIEEAGVRKVVNLSSAGADQAEGTGPIVGLHDQEERLNEITHADIMHLRCGFFMENLLTSVPTIFSAKRIYGTLPGDLPMSFCATKDIADRATELLINPSFKGHNVEYVLGERDVTMDEVARIISAIMQMPGIEYAQLSDADMKGAMLGAGLTEGWADSYNEMNHAFVDGKIGKGIARTSRNTTPTSIEEFARTTFLEAAVKAARHKVKADHTRHEPRP